MVKIADKLKAAKELKRNKLFLIALVFLILLYLDFSFIIKPQLKAVKIVNQKITKIRKDIVSLDRNSAIIQKLKLEGLNTQKKGDVSKAKRIITEEGMQALLQDISDRAGKNNVKIMQIRPLRDSKGKEEIIAGVKLLPVTITLDLHCSYHSLGSFINTLENSASFIVVQDAKIISNPSDYLSQNVNLVLKTYVKK